MTHTRVHALLSALLLSVCFAAAAPGQLSAAADEGHGWLVLPRGDHYEVYHHAPGDDWLAWRRSDEILLTLPQRAVCYAATPHRAELTLVFAAAELPGQRDVRRKEAVYQEAVRRWTWQPNGRLRVLPSLPADSELRGLAADPHGVVYALIQGRSSSVARSPREQPASDDSSGIPAAQEPTRIEQGEEVPPPPAGAARTEEGAAARPHVGPATRVLRLESDGWVEAALPATVDTADVLAWHLLSTRTGIALLAREPHADIATLYERRTGTGQATDEAVGAAGADEGAEWTAVPLPVPLDEVRAAGVEAGGLVVALAQAETGDGEPGQTYVLSVELVRGDRRLPIAVVSALERDSVILFSGPDVVLISEADEVQPFIRVYEIATGRLRREGRFGEPPVLTQRSIQPLLIVFALLVAAVAMVVFKPEPGAVVVALSRETEPADIAGRLLAFLIDLLPTMVVVGLLSGLSLGAAFDSLRALVFFQSTTETLPPALAILLLTLLHQGLSEWLAGRTLGKALTGLVVLDALGGRLGFRQAVVRNALKFVLLLFPILLLLAVWNPWRQHLGDMASRTVVASRPRAELPPPDRE